MKKTIFATIMSCIMFISFVNITALPVAWADDTVAEEPSTTASELWAYESFTYGDKTGIAVTEYKGTASDIFIPAKIDGLPVLKVGDGLFKNKSGINSVSLGEGIKVIGESAFENLSDLVCIVIPKTLAEIGENAFSGCSAFNSVVLYSAVTSIGSGAFFGCDNVKIYGAEDSVAQTYATENNLTFVVISQNATPETVTSDGITYYITNGEAVVVSADEALTEVTIPATVNNYPVTQIVGAFENHDKLKSVTISGNVTTIGKDAFYGCDVLTSITIPDGVTTIGATAFGYCRNISGITIPDSVTSIGSYAFANSGLYRITIGNGVTTIGEGAFGHTHLYNVVIPDNVTAVGSYAFEYCSGLKNVTMSSNVTIIEDKIFMDCEKLETVNIPEGVTSIGEYAFYGCIPLKAVVIPKSVTKIQTNSFTNTILCVYSDSYAYTFAIENDLLYYITQNGELPEIIEQDGIYYYITNGEAIAFSAYTNLKTAVIPDTINDYPVTSLIRTFYNNSYYLESVTIGKNVTSIGDYTFYRCNKLTSISIPDSVTLLGKSAFSSCKGLTEITLPKGITSIPDSAFWGCGKLSSITIPDGVTSIGTNAFEYCASLTNITIPDSVTTIGSSAFEDCDSLTTVKLPSDLTIINSDVFRNCISLENITIPNSVTSIKGQAFCDCTSLKSIVIPDSVIEMGQGVFCNCRSLTGITLSENLKSIDHSTFSNCTSLICVVIPTSVSYVSWTAFSPNTILCVYENSAAHKWTVKYDYLYYITQNGELPEIIKQDGICYYAENDELIAVSADETLTTVNIPETINNYPVTQLKAIFRNNTSITSVTLPNSVTNIDSYAFYGCTALKKVTLPDKITSIEENMFYNCKGLTELTLPDNLTSIGKSAFGNCSRLTSLEIPDSVTSIGSEVFMSCSALKSVTLPDGLKSIPYCAFQYCSSLENLVIPDSVTSIGESAFLICRNLNVEIPAGVTAIGSTAFSGCSKLTSVTIPAGITKIHDNTFNHCTGLTSITIPDGVTSIDVAAFARCTGLASVVIPDSVTSISSSAFSDCPALTSVVIPDSVTSLSKTSFPANTILCVYENSYAHTFAADNNLLYFIIRKTANPEISYGIGISGKATYSDGTAVQNAPISIYYDDGMLKETVTTDAGGSYSFTYAEVGAYTIRVTDANGNTASEAVSVKRMNAFDVFLAGETNITVKNSYKVSGAAPADASITLTDQDGRTVVVTEAASDGTFEFLGIANGEYIIKAENDIGSCVKEITVYNADLNVGTLEIAENEEFASIVGTVLIEGREQEHYKRSWVQVTLYNSVGVPVFQTKTDKDGNYEFARLPLDEYSIVAEVSELRHDHAHGYDRSYTLIGYAYVNAAESKQYTAEEIILTEENNNICEISGTVYSGNAPATSDIILKNVFHHEIARARSGLNGKYTFKNVRDGLYFIFATTENDGMGFTVAVVRHSKIYGNTDILIYKPERIKEHERTMKNIPHCESREEANRYREQIRQEKEFYDGLSEKEKMHFSQEYVERLNRLCEWCGDCEYKENGGKIINGGMLLSEDEFSDDNTKIELVLTVTEMDAHKISSDGIKTEEDFIQQSMDEAMHGREPAKYYDISLTKNGTKITDISKQTNSTGKIRITLEIPEEYRGHNNYTFVHMHNGVPTTLVDLDDNPNTVTFEINRFSAFALTYSDVELASATEDSEIITYSNGKITINSPKNATLYIAEYDGDTLKKVEMHTITLNKSESFDFNDKQTAFLWDENLAPVCGKFNILE